ncbi:MAG TPA: hypothetical protein VMR02_21210 [Terracidiphilus sp.]|jgi:hypothetical protein|nr:hypothetical protein [Terracidiphilus sp.]
MRRSFLAVVLLVSSPLLIAQQAMTNDSVIKLVKAGLSDDLIVTTINASPANYDTSANGLIALKGAGVSDKVLSAIVVKSSGGAPASSPAPTAPASNGLPAGIDEIGVYYKNKSGAWVALMPEVVNFKTGGVMKSIASAGIVKGDVNGHIVGPKAKMVLTFPVVLAVYAPEGVAITEYQLLRLHPNSDSREFRSVTGGVMHVSGGATRDLIDFQSDKLAPRVYQITMQSTLGKGEFGLLPPGAYGSSNMGSSGKIYSMSVPE